MNKEEKKLFYRFRPIIVKKAEYKKDKDGIKEVKKEKTVLEELQNQEIFFGSIEENDDPMDGFSFGYWEGDEIVWKRFLEHYLLCLMWNYNGIRMLGDTVVHNTVLLQTPEDLPTDIMKEQYNIFVKKAFNNDLLQMLVKYKKFSIEELSNILMTFHVSFVNTYESILNKSDFNLNISQAAKERAINLIDKFNKIDFSKIDRKHFQFASEMVNMMSYESSLIIRYNTLNQNIMQKTFKDNIINFLSSFPKYYLEKFIKQFIYPIHYISSFTINKNDSAMWGNYADGHRGICLVFEPRKHKNKLILDLETKNKQKIAYDFNPVDYDNISEINFFEYMGRLNMKSLDWWFSDGTRKSSKLDKYTNKDEYRKKYWEKFYKKNNEKFEAWKHEKEYRSITYGLFENGLDANQRIHEYNIDQLEGIIFGIRTEESLKLKIMELIEEKLKSKVNKTIKFYQAYYSNFKRTIEVKELPFIKFKN